MPEANREREGLLSRSPATALLCVLLAVSLVGNILIVDRYNLYSKTREKWLLWRNPVPEIELKGILQVHPLGALRTVPGDRASEEDVHKWQEATRSRLLDLLGVEMPTSARPVRTISTENVDGIRRELIAIRQADGLETPAYLLLPATPPPHPVVIVIPGHSYGIVATAGIIGDMQHNNALAHARAGFAVLTVEVRGFGYLRYMPTPHGWLDLKGHVFSCLVEGHTAVGHTVADVESALEYLVLRPDIDESRIGVAGFSSGGLAAIYLAALDDRIKAVVASGCVSSFQERYYSAWNDAYETIPGFSKYLTMGDCLGLLAPRPLLAHWGDKDRGRGDRTSAYNATSIPTWEEGRRIYRLLGADDRIHKHVSKGLRHEFDCPRSVRFFQQALPTT